MVVVTVVVGTAMVTVAVVEPVTTTRGGRTRALQAVIEMQYARKCQWATLPRVAFVVLDGALVASPQEGNGRTCAAHSVGMSAVATEARQVATGGIPLDPVLLAGKNAQEIMDAVVEAVRPIDGTQDAEASRLAIKGALSELLARFADADLMRLSVEQREYAIERYVALDVYQRFYLDLGQTILEKTPSAVTGLARLKEVKDYIKETVASAFRSLRQRGTTVGSAHAARVVREALHEALEIFEGYAE